MKLIENVHYEAITIKAGAWGFLAGEWLFCVLGDGEAKLVRITDPDICREDVKRHFEKIARERKATARNRKSVAIRRGKE